jgi:hypothetical protein
MTKMALQSAMGAEVARNIAPSRLPHVGARCLCHLQRQLHLHRRDADVGTTRFAAVRVRHEPRRVGTSNYTLRKLVTHALNMMTGFSTLPLQLASWDRFIFTLFGLGVLLYVVVNYMVRGGSVPGFAFLASIVAIFSGAQLFALGIMANTWHVCTSASWIAFLRGARHNGPPANRNQSGQRKKTDAAPARTDSTSLWRRFAVIWNGTRRF